MPKRKVAFFLPHMGGGGAERVHLAIIRRLVAAGLEVQLVLRERAQDEDRGLAGSRPTVRGKQRIVDRAILLGPGSERDVPLGRGAAALGDARLITKGEKPVDGLLHRFGIEAVERNPDPLAFQHHVHVADPGIAEAGNTAAEIFGKLGGSARQLGMTDLMIAVPALMPAIAAGTSRWSAAWMVTQEGSVPWPSAARG